VEHADGSRSGVCEEGRCERRIYRAGDPGLTLHTVADGRLRHAVAAFLGIRGDGAAPAHPCVLPLGQLRAGHHVFHAKLVGGRGTDVCLQRLQRLWEDGCPRQLILFASRFGHKEQMLHGFLTRAGWPFFYLEDVCELMPRGLRWLPGERERWQAFLEGLPIGLGEDAEAERRLLRAIDRGFSSVQVNMRHLMEENEKLKLSLQGQFIAVARQVEPEYFHWILTVIVAGSVSRAAEMLGVPNSTFDQRLRKYRARGGAYQAIFDLVAVRRKILGTRSLEHFNDEYLRHQADGRSGAQVDEDLLTEVLEALQAQDRDNWPAIRDEVIDLLKEHL